MVDKNENPKSFCTCLENAQFAEMMQKVMGSQGIGTLCAEMMKKAGQKDGKDFMAHCTEMMQAMTRGCAGTEKESAQTDKEANHAGNK